MVGNFFSICLVFKFIFRVSQFLQCLPDENIESMNETKILKALQEEKEDFNEKEDFKLARLYFETKEYYKCADVLKYSKIQKSIFLRCYSLFLVCLIEESIIFNQK